MLTPKVVSLTPAQANAMRRCQTLPTPPRVNRPAVKARWTR